MPQTNAEEHSEGVEDFTEAAEVEAPLSAATETRRRKRKARSTTTPAPAENHAEVVVAVNTADTARVTFVAEVPEPRLPSVETRRKETRRNITSTIKNTTTNRR